jgi:hypothetical protein
MNGPLYSFFAADHRRLEKLFEAATVDPENVDEAVFLKFREGLLRHIRMEENVLLPAAKRCRGGSPHPLAEKIRLDHGAIATLLVPSPSKRVVIALKGILAIHDELEEKPGGLYDTCEALTAGETNELLAKLRETKPVAVRPYNDEPFVFESVRSALARAGYNWDEF